MFAGDGQFSVPIVQQPRRSSRASMQKSARPRLLLMVISPRLAALKSGSFPVSSINVRAFLGSRFGSFAAQSSRCVSSSSFIRSRQRYAGFRPDPSGQNRPEPRTAPLGSRVVAPKPGSDAGSGKCQFLVISRRRVHIPGDWPLLLSQSKRKLYRDTAHRQPPSNGSETERTHCDYVFNPSC